MSPERPTTVDIDGDVYEIAADRLDLPPGFKWEYYTCEDGGGSVSWSNGEQHSETITPTVMRRAVGPWEIHRERKRINA